jgi:uncharacterized lipoprotein YddW (UPF0748 family)
MSETRRWATGWATGWAVGCAVALAACSSAPQQGSAGPTKAPPTQQQPQSQQAPQQPPQQPPNPAASPARSQHPTAAAAPSPTLDASAAPGAPTSAARPKPGSVDNPPPEPREFRAAWVATVGNIDWPSAPGLPSERQRSEALAILNKAQALGLNALILQVRPAGDAIYPSTLEPWSEWLTGASGRAPDPAWDPLAFWVQQAHQRGLELHAWFNPYRARAASKTLTAPLAAPHLAVLRPELVKRYGDMLWMDPGEAAAAAHTLAVVADVVRRYNVDGVHIDDYFYPYPISADGVEQPFPDDESYARYRLAGGELVRADWRRNNVDQLVQQLYTSVHAIKPWVRVGISPFGLGRPDRRPTALGPGSGFSQYDKLYANVERWLEKEWLDYLAPQLYWTIDRSGLQFPVLLDYWAAQTTPKRHLWPGLFTSLVNKAEAGAAPNPRVWPAREVLDQVALVRKQEAAAQTTQTTGASGHIHFSMVALMQDRDGLATQLKQGPYAHTALVPATPWLGASAPAAPRWARGGVGNDTRWALHAGPGEAPTRYALWRRVGEQWRLSVVPAQTLAQALAQASTPTSAPTSAPAPTWVEPEGADLLVASGISRTGVLGARASLPLNTPARVAP